MKTDITPNHGSVGAAMSGLDCRVVIVTGRSRGVGRGIALRLAAEGAIVAINYRRNAEAAEQVVR